MSLSYSQIKQIALEVEYALVGKVLSRVTDIPNRKFIFDFGDKSLLLCLQDPFLRFHLTSSKRNDAILEFTKYLNKHLSGAVLEKVNILNEDRILSLEFKNYRLVAEFFPKRPNAYLIGKDDTILLALNPTSHKIYQVPIGNKQPLSTEENTTSQSVENFYLTHEREVEFLKRKNHLENIVKREKSRLEKRQKKEAADLEKALKWNEIQHEALLIQANLYQLKKGMDHVRVADWEKEGLEVEIALDRTLEPKDELVKRFLRARKLKASIPHIQKEMEKQQQHLLDCEKKLQKISSAESLEDLKFFEKPLKNEVVVDVVPYREYTSASGLKIWVGKSAAKNDLLTFTYAKGLDWWLHVSGFSGSHVIIKVHKGQDPDFETLQDAIQLALHYSKAKLEGAADVCVTQRKYVSRFGKSSPGKVQISKHKTVYAKVDAERFKRLKDGK